MSKQLHRIGVGLMGDWLPNCPEYPHHFTEAKVGDTVWVIVLDTETDELSIEPDKILDVADYHEMAKYQKESGAPAYAELEVGPPENYLIDFWLEKYSPGHGLDFGTEIFRSFDEAAFVLLQCYTDKYEDYIECLAEIRKWRQEYEVSGFFNGT